MENTESFAGIAFGIFTIYLGKQTKEKKRPLFELVHHPDELKNACEEALLSFQVEYPSLAEVILNDPGDADAICSLYREGEGILPSKTFRMHWIILDAPGSHPEAVNAETAGKWLIFLEKEAADPIWEKIRAATWAGNLGISAKVSTAKANPQSRDDRLVIYVYTRDWEDTDEVMRVREKIREFGITDRIGYKRNIETFAGEYSSVGKRVTYYNA